MLAVGKLNIQSSTVRDTGIDEALRPPRNFSMQTFAIASSPNDEVDCTSLFSNAEAH